VAARAVLMRLFCRFESIATIFADGGYTGKLIDWAKDMFGYSVEIVKRASNICFKCCPNAGLSSAPSPNATALAAFVKTTN
jgi:hypothetical protein